MSKPLVEGIRARVQEIDRERDHLVALLRLYENGTASVATDRAIQVAATRDASSRKPFQVRAGGPTERILQVVSDSPGLIYSEIVEKAMQGITSDADDPRRSLGSTLQSLVKRGKIERRQGRHFPVANG